jgi:hypothetical protein
MAISFLNSINLTQNELIKARIENQPDNIAAGTGVEGQLYYDTTLDVLKVWANGLWTEVGGGVLTVSTNNSTFINLANVGTAANPSLTASLSATGTPDNTKYLRGDNTWSSISNPTITLSGDVTGSGTTSIATTIASGAVEFSMMDPTAIVTSSEGIPSNNNDVTLPTSAAVKAYVDASVAGGLVYQGGYNAATNTPNLDSPGRIEGIKKGWTYTVTADGTFFTEQVRVGDVLIAEVDFPTTLAEWTTVQNNIDLASLTQVGIGNVNAGTGINVSYSSGTATVSTQTTSYATTISASGTVPHNLATRDVMVQLYDTVTFETVYADVVRTNVDAVTVTFASTPTNPIRVLVQK